jgi:hypothetical protein
MNETFKDLFARGYQARREDRLADSRAIFIEAVRKASIEADRPSLAEALCGLAQAERDVGNTKAASHHSLRRCMVPADSFFEWEKTQQGKKPKFEFTIRDRQPFGMAGLWAPWKNPKTNQWEDTFAIVTVDANETMAPVHNRQPAILAPRDYQEYLENAERPPIYLLRVFPDDEMRAEEIDQEAISNGQASLFDSQ